jgi:cell division protein FtsB
MIDLKNRKILLIAIAGFFLVAIAYITFNDDGIVKYIKLKNKVEDLQAQVNSIEAEKKSLEAEIDSLEKKVPSAIERVAREQYQMTRKNEVKIKIDE